MWPTMQLLQYFARILHKYRTLDKKDIDRIIPQWPRQQILNKSTIDAIEQKGHRIMC